MGNKIIGVKVTIYDFHTWVFLLLKCPFHNLSWSSLCSVVNASTANLTENVKIMFLFLGKLWSNLSYSQHCKKLVSSIISRERNARKHRLFG